MVEPADHRGSAVARHARPDRRDDVGEQVGAADVPGHDDVVGALGQPPQRDAGPDRADDARDAGVEAGPGRHRRRDAALRDDDAGAHPAGDLRERGRDPPLAAGIDQRGIAHALGRDHRQARAARCASRAAAGQPLDLAAPVPRPRARARRPRPPSRGALASSASSWAVAAGDERPAHDEHAAVAARRRRPARAPPTPVSTAANAGAQRTITGDPRLLGGAQAAGDRAQVGVGLGVGDHHRRPAARAAAAAMAAATSFAPTGAPQALERDRARRRRPRAGRRCARRPSGRGRRRRRRARRRGAYSVSSSGTRSPSRSIRWTPPIVTRPAAGSAGHEQQRHVVAPGATTARSAVVLLPHVRAQRAVAAQDQARAADAAARAAAPPRRRARPPRRRCARASWSACGPRARPRARRPRRRDRTSRARPSTSLTACVPVGSSSRTTVITARGPAVAAISAAIPMIASSWPTTTRRLPSSTMISRGSRPKRSPARIACSR